MVLSSDEWANWCDENDQKTCDTIQDETSGTFTTYYDGFGWYGTLTTLRAGRMYVVTSAEKGKIKYGECI